MLRELVHMCLCGFLHQQCQSLSVMDISTESALTTVIFQGLGV